MGGPSRGFELGVLLLGVKRPSLNAEKEDHDTLGRSPYQKANYSP